MLTSKTTMGVVKLLKVAKNSVLNSERSARRRRRLDPVSIPRSSLTIILRPSTPKIRTSRRFSIDPAFTSTLNAPSPSELIEPARLILFDDDDCINELSLHPPGVLFLLVDGEWTRLSRVER